MCGIVGVLGREPPDPELVAAMRDTLTHRGPDHGGMWSGEGGRVVLGHRRLSILDLSPAAHQPLLAHDGRFAITYNGEVYNYRSLRQELGARFRTESDTEVLVEAFRHRKEGCLERFSGMFAFALWDAAERRLFCARDRVGEKPFHYAQVGESFLFASELKALVAWPDSAAASTGRRSSTT